MILSEKERELVVAALESDEGLVNRRKMLKQLDRLLEAWRIYSNRKKEIAKMLKPKSSLGQIARTANATNNVFNDDISGFDQAYLQWFDELIQSLEPEQKSLLGYEIFSKERNRADLWARYWGVTSRTYYNLLSETRDQLVLAVVGRKV